MMPYSSCLKVLSLVLPLYLLAGCSSLPGGLTPEPDPVIPHKALLSDPDTRALIQIPQLEEYLNEVLQKVLRAADPSENTGSSIHVHIAATAGSGIGADAYPDNNIYVRWNTMSALHSEDQLAALLAHEVSHLLKRHGRTSPWLSPVTSVAEFTIGLTPILNDAYSGVGLPFWSRQQELDADAMGLILMSKAGYNPDAYFDLFQILEAASIPADIPSSFSALSGKMKKTDPTEVPFNELRFGSLEKTHPDFTERRAALSAIIKEKRRELSFPDQKNDRFDLVRNSASVAPSLRGIEAAVSALEALRTKKDNEARAQLQIARNSPIGNIPDLELLSIRTAGGNKAQQLMRLQSIATAPQAPIIYPLLMMEYAFEAKNWQMASNLGLFILNHYDPNPKMLPSIYAALKTRSRQIEQIMPKLSIPFVTINGKPPDPVPTPTRQFKQEHPQEHEEWGQIQRALPKLELACAKTGSLLIKRACLNDGFPLN